jgi:hypothetical protein
VKGNDLLGAIEAQKNVLSLDEARRQLAQLEEDLESRAASQKASLAVLEERRHKATLAMQIAEKNIESTTLIAPLDGLVVVKENQDASGGMFYSGMVLPEYRPGDQAWPGRLIAEVMEVSQLEILTKVNEQDRSSILAGQEAEIQADAMPQAAATAKVATLGGLASRRIFDTSTRRQFDVTFRLDRPDPHMRPGRTVQVRLPAQQLENVLYAPRQALFEKDGQNVVYVKVGNRFEPKEVKLKLRTESHVVLEDVDEGLEVALVNPEGPAATVAPPPEGAGPAGATVVRTVM